MNNRFKNFAKNYPAMQGMPAWAKRAIGKYVVLVLLGYEGL